MKQPQGDQVTVEIGDNARQIAAGKNNVLAEHLNVRTAIINGAKFNLNLGNILTPDQDVDAEKSEDEASYLDRVEDLVKQELRKSGSQEFVDLSMEISDPGHHPSDNFRRNFKYAFGSEAEVDPSSHEISGLQGLEASLLEHHNIVLLGAPGSGKSTVLQHMTLRMIYACRENKTWDRLPLYVPLTRYLIDEHGRVISIEKFLRGQVASLVGTDHFVYQKFDRLARKGRFVFLLDGLDQMPDRRSDTIRLDRLRKTEADLRKIDRIVKITRAFGLQRVASELQRTRQAISSEVAPTIDLRELEINKIANLYASPGVASCRQRDFVGSPDWQAISVLPMSDKQIDEFLENRVEGGKKTSGSHGICGESARQQSVLFVDSV